LIVVGANSLEARRLKQTIDDISAKLKSFGSNKDLVETGDKRNSKADEDRPLRDVSVIWGSMEVPKLFANSHSS